MRSLIPTNLPPEHNIYTGAYTRLGGNSDMFGTGFRCAVDMYLDLSDPTVTNATPFSGYGWDVSAQAAQKGLALDENQGPVREAVFHAAAYGATSSNGIVIAVSDASDFLRRNDLLSLNHHIITNSGWYTFEWVFRDNGSGILAIDCNVRTAGGELIWTTTVSNPADVISTKVGGNRLMFFTFLDVPRLPIDNTILERFVPVTCVPASGSTFSSGTNWVVCSATDACGHTTNGSFPVVVVDAEPPSVSCPGDLVQGVDPGQVYATVTFAPSASDDCGPANVVCVPPSGAQFSIGTNTVLVTATDAFGNTNQCSFNVIVVAPPIILAQPDSTFALVGGSAGFSLLATGEPPLAYQWYANDAPLSDATNASLVLSPVRLADAGTYFATVTGVGGSVTSSVATLRVYANTAATLLFLDYAEEIPLIEVTGVPGYTYAVEASTNLVDWVRVTTNSSPFQFTDSAAPGNPVRFYRACNPP